MEEPCPSPWRTWEHGNSDDSRPPVSHHITIPDGQKSKYLRSILPVSSGDVPIEFPWTPWWNPPKNVPHRKSVTHAAGRWSRLRRRSRTALPVGPCHGTYPKNGWFFVDRIENGGWLGVALWLRKPPNGSFPKHGGPSSHPRWMMEIHPWHPHRWNMGKSRKNEDDWGYGKPELTLVPAAIDLYWLGFSHRMMVKKEKSQGFL